MSIATLLLVALIAQAATPGQTQPRTPARDPRVATTATGTGIIRGMVVDATSGSPIRRATVRVFGPGFQESPRSTITNDEGRFELRELPAGNFTVTAMKSGYLTGGFEQVRQTGPPPSVELADKQIVDKVIVKMTRGGVIVGRVIDEAGEPAINVELRAMQYRYGPNGRTLNAAGMMGMIRTDDLGAFRLYGLAPGQYYVVARPTDGMFGPATTAAGDTGPANTFFPNAPDAGTAQRVTVAVGRDTGPILITLVSTKLSRVRGRALMSNGEPFASTFVNINMRDDNGMSSGRSGGRTRPDGSFEIVGLTPGTYEVEVRPQSFNRDDDAEVARQTITVAGDDIDGLLLIGAKPGVARGKVVTDDGTPIGYSGMTIMAQVVGPGVRFFSPPANVKDDLTFELKGLFGQRLLRMGGFASPPRDGPWMLKAVMLNGVDIIDKPIDIAPGALIEGIEMVFTRKAAELSGTVTMSGGAPLEQASIILFPADESLWRDTGRFVRLARPNKEGVYKFGMLPAHDDYLLVTALQLEPGQHMDPDFLKSVRDRAMRLSLYEGEKRVQNIRIAAMAQ